MNMRTLDVDNLNLAGKRIRLRSTIESDREALVKIRATPAVKARWHGDDLVAEFAEDLADAELTQLTIEADGLIIGLIQFSEEEDPDYRHASLDIYIDPAVHRRGYATEAIQTLVEFLLTARGHHRLTIDPAVDNQAAIDCYRSVGFQPIGVMRQYERQADGAWSDGLLMELLRDDWSAPKG